MLASALNGKQTFAAGVEFYEARFKKQFAPGHCFKPGDGGSSGTAALECRSAGEASRLMKDGSFLRRTQQGDVGPASSRLSAARLAKEDWPRAHLCRMGSFGGASSGTLRVPGNASAPTASLYIAPQARTRRV